jgi:hypothetical protein
MLKDTSLAQDKFVLANVPSYRITQNPDYMLRFQFVPINLRPKDNQLEMMFDAVYLALYLQYASDEQLSRFTLDVNRHKSIFPKPNCGQKGHF